MNSGKLGAIRKKHLEELKTLKISHFVLLTIAGIVNAVGVTLLLAPLNLLDSGVSGLSLFLSGLTPDYLPLSFFLVIINFPLYLFAFRKMGAGFCVYSVFAIGIYSLASYLIQYVIPFNFTMGSPIVGDDKLLGAVFGGILSGVGSGLTIRYGGALDGIEVLAVGFAKKLGLTVGGFVMVFNAVLYLVAALVYNSWQLPLYSIIAYAIGLKAVDFVVDGLDKAKAANIITSQEEKLSRALSENLGRGVTILEAKGYYTGEHKSMLYCVVNRFQINKLKKIIREIDPAAFVTITDISDAFGRSKKLASYLPAEKRYRFTTQKAIERYAHKKTERPAAHAEEENALPAPSAAQNKNTPKTTAPESGAKTPNERQNENRRA